MWPRTRKVDYIKSTWSHYTTATVTNSAVLHCVDKWHCPVLFNYQTVLDNPHQYHTPQIQPLPKLGYICCACYLHTIQNKKSMKRVSDNWWSYVWLNFNSFLHKSIWTHLSKFVYVLCTAANAESYLITSTAFCGTFWVCQGKQLTAFFRSWEGERDDGIMLYDTKDSGMVSFI